MVLVLFGKAHEKSPPANKANGLRIEIDF